MKTVQEIFNGIIEDDLYQSQGYFMCVSVDFAWDRGLITDEEHDLCRDALYDFLECYPTLHGKFIKYGFLGAELTKEVRLEIYKNWERRQEIFDKFVGV